MQSAQIGRLEGLVETAQTALESVNGELEQFISANGFQTNSPHERDVADRAREIRQDLNWARSLLARANRSLSTLSFDFQPTADEPLGEQPRQA